MPKLRTMEQFLDRLAKQNAETLKKLWHENMVERTEENVALECSPKRSKNEPIIKTKVFSENLNEQNDDYDHENNEEHSDSEGVSDDISKLETVLSKDNNIN